MITKVVAGVAIAVGALVWAAAPATADPDDPFCDVSCGDNCQSPVDGTSTDQIAAGIQRAESDVQAAEARP